MEDSEVRRKVQEKNFAELLQYDQVWQIIIISLDY